MKFSKLNIRQAKFCDIDSIAKIKVTGWQSAYKGIIDYKYLESMSVSEQVETIKKYPLETIFIAEEDNEILGFCRIYDYNKPAYKDKKIDCEIREIYVKPDVKRMGIGSQLFYHTLNIFKQAGKKKLYLGCFKENYNARKFYEKTGGILDAESVIDVGGKYYPIVSYVYNLGD